MTDIDGNGLKLLLDTLIRELRQHQSDESGFQIRLEDKVSGIKVDVEVLKARRSDQGSASASRSRWLQVLVTAGLSAVVAIVVLSLKGCLGP